ncbi:uncharacterized protein N7503_000597 [Penicillium pulvis]|uniref:uncharacterized protein n=1 Tax=Penicillium pulvis TaxID=1562058 RepID=UPI00254665EE|nr:uncharacterized protein N7503_000597 [Penicillium pulvis]KAJ5813847.1 hypothetical protein N7503_000597 [Penicillium pulvis]
MAPILAAYIANIVPGSLEADVDHLWTNILAYYFPISERYGVEREAYIRSRSQTKANVCVSTLSRNLMFKAIIVENKRASSSQTGFPPPTSWIHATSQLLGYMLSRRSEQPRGLASLFGIVGIGRLRQANTVLEDYDQDGLIYHLVTDNDVLEDYDQDGLIYHLVTDNEAIEQILLAMKRPSLRLSAKV